MWRHTTSTLNTCLGVNIFSKAFDVCHTVLYHNIVVTYHKNLQKRVALRHWIQQGLADKYRLFRTAYSALVCVYSLSSDWFPIITFWNKVAGNDICTLHPIFNIENKFTNKYLHLGRFTRKSELVYLNEFIILELLLDIHCCAKHICNLNFLFFPLKNIGVESCYE